jgi:alpha-tubulin suppressor-like RCC1 family protein
MRGQHESIVSIACGLRHNVALTADGRVLTWGFGAEGCLGHGEAEAVPEVSREGGHEDRRTRGHEDRRKENEKEKKRKENEEVDEKENEKENEVDRKVWG